ncbi:hypothetical protein K1Y77_08865 [Halomonas qaidamensis]|uniref:Uncharacterized protein n=1 Tax=Halomonas qaidamensis TaxID=2866211 RepID=A0ABY6JJL5_9GAMM|nr:hypothetical protein [Halomonas qaidamensis]UYV17621.1 hypothetical protein K1Y77_08865 [Halomonas qaidamensis]
MSGEEPPLVIDHEDRYGTNNRWDYLRDEAGRNYLNMTKHSNNTICVTGES